MTTLSSSFESEQYAGRGRQTGAQHFSAVTTFSAVEQPNETRIARSHQSLPIQDDRLSDSPEVEEAVEECEEYSLRMTKSYPAPSTYYDRREPKTDSGGRSFSRDGSVKYADGPDAAEVQYQVVYPRPGAAPPPRREETAELTDDDEDASSSLGRPPPPTDRYGFIQPDPGASAEPLGTPTLAREVSLPVGTLRKRESKWLSMLDNWPFFMNKKFDKVKERCRKGIPSALRGRAWTYLCGAAFHMDNIRSRNVFEQLDAHPGNANWNEEIKKDISRQFPEHELFSREGPYGKLGRTDLYRLLKAWTVLHAEEGYCQGQAPVAATLLMHMPLRDAFYCFVQICHKYLPGYYSPGLEAIQLDGDILQELLRKKSHPTYKHLKKNNIDPVLYMLEWFMCIFCRTLPWATVVRIWDMFFCEGVKVLFKVALVLFKYSLGSREQLKKYPGMYEIVERLRNLPPPVVDEHFLVARMEEMHIDEEDLERIHYKQWKKRQNKKLKEQSPRSPTQ